MLNGYDQIGKRLEVESTRRETNESYELKDIGNKGVTNGDLLGSIIPSTTLE